MSPALLNIPRLFYVASLITLFVSFARFGWDRRFPVFFFLQGVIVVQTAAHYTNMDMDSSWWFYWALLLVILRIACAMEIVGAWTENLRNERIALMIAMSVLSVGVGAGVFVAPHGEPNALMADLIWKVNAGLIAALGIALCALHQTAVHVPRCAQTHGLLFMALMANQVAGIWLGRWVNPEGAAWRAVMGVTYTAAALIQASWLLAIRGDRWVGRGRVVALLILRWRNWRVGRSGIVLSRRVVLLLFVFLVGHRISFL